MEALEESLGRHGAPEISNTDQGSQFTSDAFTGLLKANGIQVSMDGKGSWCELFDGRFRYREFAVGWLAPTKPTSCSHIALFGEQRGYSDNNGGGEVLHPEG